MVPIKERKKTLFLIIALALVVGVRLIHLGADTPPGVSRNVGLYIDEGYKTLAPRNLALFGSTRWCPEDEYRGWMTDSPLTQWPYYFAFKLGGVNISSARLVTICYFLILLFSYIFAMKGRYKGWLLYAGLFALGFQSTLFFFSRVALFEIAISTLVYSTLFLLLKYQRSNVIVKTGILLFCMLIATIGIKKSALLYFLPVIGAFVLNDVVQWQLPKTNKRMLSVFLVLILCSALLLVFFRDIWLHRIAHSFWTVSQRTLIPPSLYSAPFVTLLGLLVVFCMLIFYQEEFFKSTYMLGILGINILCPLILGLLSYGPMRYYVPILPAGILIFLEWFHQKSSGGVQSNEEPAVNSLFAIGFFFLFIYYSCAVVNIELLSRIPVKIGDEPGISGPTMVKYLSFPLLLIAIGLFRFRRSTLFLETIKLVMLFIVVVGTCYNSHSIFKFLLHPSYQSEIIRAEIQETVEPDSVVAGDWAPFFCINTKQRALYMNDNFNQKKLRAIKPGYLLCSFDDSSNMVNDPYKIDPVSKYSLNNINVVNSTKGVELGKPQYLLPYVGKKLVLFPLIYD